MKIIGLIGGMSWQSSLEYYRIINQKVKSKLGGFHSAKSILFSVDFAEIEELQSNGRWDEAGAEMAKAALALERAGADVIVICTNTMHKLIDYINQATKIPLLHIADATAELIRRDKITKIGLLGTRFTMEQDFYKGRLIDKFGLTVLTPNEFDQTTVHDIIYNELCKGIVSPESKVKYLEIIDKLILNGAEGIILGCTEIELLISTTDCNKPLYQTAKIHAEAAVEFALS